MINDIPHVGKAKCCLSSCAYTLRCVVRRFKFGSVRICPSCYHVYFIGGNVLYYMSCELDRNQQRRISGLWTSRYSEIYHIDSVYLIIRCPKCTGQMSVYEGRAV